MLVLPDSLAFHLETTFSGGSRRLLQTMKIASLQWRVGGSECRTPPRREGITLVFYETAAMLQMQQFRLVFAVVVLLPIRPAQLPPTRNSEETQVDTRLTRPKMWHQAVDLPRYEL